jgi:GH15 family glucan-1,4-alpha-glucosidase
VTAEYLEINSYGLIGDLHTAALVGPNGSIDWCCLPYFDSPSTFGALLDHQKGGQFQIAPADYERSFTSYLSRTNILQTVFLGDRSRVSLYDFMPIEGTDGRKTLPDAAAICRIVECDHGAEVRLRVRYRPRPDFGRRTPRLDFSPRLVEADVPLWLLSNHDVEWAGDGGEGELVLHNGDRVVFVLASGRPLPTDRVGHWGREQFLKTRDYWESWIQQSLYRGRWQAAVERAALALKLLTFKPTGAVLAAATTSLPETLGGERNWDYRFSWLRDSALVLNALYLLGFQEEAREYVGFLTR